MSSGWLGGPRNREIGPGRSKDLSIEFDRHASAIESDYRLTLNFANGCVVELQPVDPAGAPEVFFPTLVSADQSGQGSHVASIVVNGDKGATGRFNGVAPNAYLVVVKAFDGDGQGTYYSLGSDGFVWSDGSVWSDGFVWSDALTEPASINAWVEQE